MTLPTGSKFQLGELCQHWTTLSYPDIPGPAAEEGTRKHAIIRDYLDHGTEVDEPWFKTVKSHLGRTLPKGDLFTELAVAIGADGEVRVLPAEHERDYRAALPTDLVMTIDLAVVGSDLVTVWDWKTGKTKPGPADDSLQLGAGALAMCLLHHKSAAQVAYKYVGDSRVTTDAATLGGAELQRVARRLRVIRELGTEPHPGEHCERLWCPARGVCSAWRVSGTPTKTLEKEKRAMGRVSIKKGSESPLCLVVYGRGGVGKTSFAAGAPSPVFICEPDGLRQFPDIPRAEGIESLEDVIEVVDSLATDRECRTVVIDTLDWIETFCRAKVVEEKGKFEESFGQGFKDERVYWIDFQSHLDKCRTAGKHIVLLSHATVKQRRDPTVTDGFDCWIPSLAPVLVDLWRNWSSALLFATYEMAVTVEGRGASKKIRGVSDGTRVLYTDERAGFVAKNRYSLPFELPLDWSAFESAVRAGRVASPEQLRGAISALIETASPELAKTTEEYLSKAGDDSAKLAKLLNWTQAELNKESEAA